MGMKRVVVHIDRLVLKGFRHEDRHDIAVGLQAELGACATASLARSALTIRVRCAKSRTSRSTS